VVTFVYENRRGTGEGRGKGGIGTKVFDEIGGMGGLREVPSSRRKENKAKSVTLFGGRKKRRTRGQRGGGFVCVVDCGGRMKRQWDRMWGGRGGGKELNIGVQA